MNKKTILISLLFLSISPFIVKSQVTEAEKKIRATTNDTIDGWKTGGSITLNLTQTKLENWSAGGQNSVSASGLLSLYANYKKGKSSLENYLDLAYGSIKQEPNDNWWKTDDKIDFTSKFGRKVFPKWYYAVLFNFKSQIAKGYNYPDDSTEISKFLAPGYFLGSLGMDYKPNDKFSAYIAPLTSKITVVNDGALSNAGAFGVDPGKKSRSEFGGYMRFFYKIDVMENVTLQSKLDLFSNYIDKPEKVDWNWETLITMKVNKYISATLFTHLLFDDDIEFEEDGKKVAKVQFKEVLGVGFSYKF